MTGQIVTDVVGGVLNGEDNIVFVIMFPLLTLIVSMLEPLKFKQLRVTIILAVLLPPLSQ
jgi:hypothetical protein